MHTHVYKNIVQIQIWSLKNLLLFHPLYYTYNLLIFLHFIGIQIYLEKLHNQLHDDGSAQNGVQAHGCNFTAIKTWFFNFQLIIYKNDWNKKIYVSVRVENRKLKPICMTFALIRGSAVTTAIGVRFIFSYQWHRKLILLE